MEYLQYPSEKKMNIGIIYELPNWMEQLQSSNQKKKNRKRWKTQHVQIIVDHFQAKVIDVQMSTLV